MNNNQKGTILAVIAGLLYGFLGYFGMSIVNLGLSIPNMQFWRFLLALILSLGLIIFNKIKPFQNLYNSLLILIVGVFFYGFSAQLYFYSSLHIGTGLAMVIFFTFPAFVMLINIAIFKQEVSGIYYVAFAIIFIGLILLVDFKEATLDLWGIFLGLLTSIIYSVYVVVSERTKINSYESTMLLCFGCALTNLFVSLYQDCFSVPTGFLIWADIIGIAIISTLLPIILFLKAMVYISSEKASMLSVLEPLFVLILGVIFLGEKVSIIQVIGSGIILSGGMLTLLCKKQKAIH